MPVLKFSMKKTVLILHQYLFQTVPSTIPNYGSFEQMHIKVREAKPLQATFNFEDITNRVLVDRKNDFNLTFIFLHFKGLFHYVDVVIGYIIIKMQTLVSEISNKVSIIQHTRPT